MNRSACSGSGSRKVGPAGYTRAWVFYKFDAICHDHLQNGLVKSDAFTMPSLHKSSLHLVLTMHDSCTEPTGLIFD